MLTKEERGLHEFALPANRHAREPLVPLTFRDVRFAIEPLRQQLQLSCRNLAALDAVEQMLKEGGRDVLATDLRHAF